MSQFFIFSFTCSLFSTLSCWRCMLTSFMYFRVVLIQPVFLYLICSSMILFSSWFSPSSALFRYCTLPFIILSFILEEPISPLRVQFGAYFGASRIFLYTIFYCLQFLYFSICEVDDVHSIQYCRKGHIFLVCFSN